MSAYYNEIEPYAAQWLRNLIRSGHIADGEVDTRSIVDVRLADLAGFTQCHFFAGIGGWSHAFRLAGWPDDRPVWTGSCPCQPFSVAGKGAGTDDARHLWPHFHRLIAACRPPVVMGEQVAGKAGYGWFDGVRSDLEATGYAGRAVDIPALAVNAPHIRQRLYWVAVDLADTGYMRRGDRPKSGEQELSPSSGLGSPPVAMVDTKGVSDNGPLQPRQRQDISRPVDAGGGFSSHMADAPLIKRNGRGCGDDLGERRGVQEQTGAGDSHMADADQGGRGRRPRDGDGERDGQAGGRVEDHGQPAGGSEDRLDVADANVSGLRQRGGDHPPAGHGHTAAPEGRSGHWDDHIWLTGSDGKSRRSQPGLPLLAHGIPNRVGKLRAYGNAIVPPLAAEVIRAFMECEP